MASCAVGPDFLHPAAPESAGYTKEPLAPRTSSADAPQGQPQRFAVGRDISAEWWTLFRSPALNALVQQSLNNNPSLQTAMANLRAARQAVYAQEGKFFPTVNANFNPTNQLTAGSITPVLNSGANPFTLYTAQVGVAYTFDVWGLNRRTVEALKAQADNQRFQVEAAYLTLSASVVIAAITEASLRGQIEATNELIAANTKMLDILRRQLNSGYANRSDVAAQEAALAQARATLPPLRKALAQQRDLLAALAGIFPNEGPLQTFRLADLRLPTDLPVSLPSQLIEQRPDIRAAQEQLHAASAEIGVSIANLLPNFTINGNIGYINTTLAGLLAPQNLFWLAAANATQTVLDGGSLFHQMQESKDLYNAAAWSYRGTVVGAVQNVSDALRALQNDADALESGARLRTCRQDQLRPRAAANAERQRQCAVAADGADHLSASSHPGGAGALRAACRYRRTFRGARRRLVESHRSAAGEDPQYRDRRSQAGRRTPRRIVRDLFPVPAGLARCPLRRRAAVLKS